jgi:hypothetical protein
MATYTSYDFSVTAQRAFEAFTREMIAMKIFSTAAEGQAIRKGQTIQVPVAATVGSAGDWNVSTNNYSDADADTLTFVDVAVTQHKKTTFSLTAEQLGQFDATGVLMAAKSKDLAYQIQADAFSLVTSGNFATAALTTHSTAFDSDDFATLWTAARTAKWGKDVNCVLNDTMYARLLLDDDLKSALASQSDSVLREAEVGRINRINVWPSQFLPTNSQTLGGFICHPSAIAIGMGVYTELSGEYDYFESMVDTETGLAMQALGYVDKATRVLYMTIEAVYGRAVARATALQRIVQTDA